MHAYMSGVEPETVQVERSITQSLGVRFHCNCATFAVVDPRITFCFHYKSGHLAFTQDLFVPRVGLGLNSEMGSSQICCIYRA